MPTGLDSLWDVGLCMSPKDSLWAAKDQQEREEEARRGLWALRVNLGILWECLT